MQNTLSLEKVKRVIQKMNPIALKANTQSLTLQTCLSFCPGFVVLQSHLKGLSQTGSDKAIKQMYAKLVHCIQKSSEDLALWTHMTFSVFMTLKSAEIANLIALKIIDVVAKTTVRVTGESSAEFVPLVEKQATAKRATYLVALIAMVTEFYKEIKPDTKLKVSSLIAS